MSKLISVLEGRTVLKDELVDALNIGKYDRVLYNYIGYAEAYSLNSDNNIEVWIDDTLYIKFYKGNEVEEVFNYNDLCKASQFNAIKWYINEWDITGECTTLDEVIYSLNNGDFTFDENGTYIED